MRKFFAVVILAATLLSLLAGCGTTVKTPETTAPPMSGVLHENVLDNFEKIVAESELADFYEVTRLPATKLTEADETHQTIVVTDAILGINSYHVSVRSNAAGHVYMTEITSSNYDDMALSLFCSYLVEAMGLDVGIVELGDNLGLLETAPSGEMSVGEWKLSTLTVSDLVTFWARYAPEAT